MADEKHRRVWGWCDDNRESNPNTSLTVLFPHSPISLCSLLTGFKVIEITFIKQFSGSIVNHDLENVNCQKSMSLNSFQQDQKVLFNLIPYLESHGAAAYKGKSSGDCLIRHLRVFRNFFMYVKNGGRICCIFPASFRAARACRLSGNSGEAVRN